MQLYYTINQSAKKAKLFENTAKNIDIPANI